MDKIKTVSPSAEEKEKEEEEYGCNGEEETVHEDKEQEEQEDINDKKDVEEEKPQDTENSTKPRDKKQIEGLNLNNEVVKMRKEVKRVRALIIRRLTRQIGVLRKKKGKDTDIERNQRRATRLLEEIHAMKALSPDLVTKTALIKNLSFDQVCKDPKSTISERAVARIGTHPQFNRRIEDIKAALKAFKEERMKTRGQEKKVKGQNKMGSLSSESSEKMRERQSEKKMEHITAEHMEITESERGDGTLKDIDDEAVASPKKKRSKTNETDDGQSRGVSENKDIKQSSLKRTVEKEIVKNDFPGGMAEEKSNPESKGSQQKREELESDLELLDDEEKEYYDDSTEERFHRQSSQSEGSDDDDDDFFVGKVNKFKKKKQNNVDGRSKVKVDPSNQDQSGTDLKAKTTLLQTVFCSSLSAPETKKGVGRRREGDNFRGREKLQGVNHPKSNCNKPPKLQKQGNRTGFNPGSKYRRPCEKGSLLKSQPTGFNSYSSGDAVKPKMRCDEAVFNHQDKKQALHPSWEASKKRKQQQGQILAFQGKKIRFDNDD